MAGYMRSGATTPTAMLQPSPAPARYSQDYAGASKPATDRPGVPLDLGPPEPPWHALEMAAVEQPASMPTVGSGGLSRQQPPPPGAQPPAGAGPAAATPAVTRDRGKGLAGSLSSSPVNEAGRPVRGPAAAILSWRHGHLFGARRGVLPPSRVPPAAHARGPLPPIATQVGRSSGFSVADLG